MTFNEILKHFSIIDVEKIETMYIGLPKSINEYCYPYITNNFEKKFNEIIEKNIPFAIDFCLVGAQYFINDTCEDEVNDEIKETYILYKENKIAYIYETFDRLHDQDEDMLDDYNKSLIKYFKIMSSI